MAIPGFFQSALVYFFGVRKVEQFLESQAAQGRDLVAGVHARSLGALERQSSQIQQIAGREISRFNETVRYIGTQTLHLGVALGSTAVLISLSGSEEHERSSVVPSIGRFALIGILAGAAINAFETQLRSIGSHALDAIQSFRYNFQRAKRKGAFIPSMREPRMDSANPCDARCIELMRAALNGDCEKIKRLQREGVHLEAKDATGKTALHWAAIGNQKKAIEWLWYYGCSLKELDRDDYLAPLHYITDPALYEHCKKLTHVKNRFSLHAPIYLFYPPENLVFKGGGAKGTAHLGAYRVLVECSLLRDLRRVAGTSAGAITALLVGLGYEPNDLEKILLKTNFMDFLDHPFQKEQEVIESVANTLAKGLDMSLKDAGKLIQSVIDGAELRGASDLKARAIEALASSFKEGGLCLGEKLLKWIEKHIKGKTGIDNCTLKEYKELIHSKGFKHLYFYATRIEPDIAPVCFNSEDPQYDDLVIADVVRASGTFPFAFKPQILRTKKTAAAVPEAAPEFGVFIDGGLIMNFPMRVFDCHRFSALNHPQKRSSINYQTLGFNFVEKPAEKKAQKGKPNVLDVAFSLKDTWKEAETLLGEAARDYHGRVIAIDSLGIDAILGCLGPEENKGKLIESGRRGARILFSHQQRLAEEHKEHDPASILSIFENERRRQLVELAEEKESEPVEEQATRTEESPPVKEQTEEARNEELECSYYKGNFNFQENKYDN